MATDLRIVELAEVCDFQGGAAFKPEFQGMASGDLPFIKVSDMNLAGNEVSITTANNWVTSETARQMGAKPAPPGSVVFAKIGEALRQNRLRQLLRATIVDNNMMAAVPKLGAIDPRFFYYALSQIDFNTIAQGTALPYLTMSVLARQRLAIPPLPEQRRIARILGTLDDKIELNRHMNETLEEMARALFTSWFVDFDPVRAKAEGRDPGLPPHLADLFPDRLVDSELGEIPEGWKLGSLGEVLVESQERTRDLAIPEYSCTDRGVVPRSQRFTKQLSQSTSRNKLVRRGDFVFGISRRILNFGMMPGEVGGVSSAYRVYRVDTALIDPDQLETAIRMRHDYYYGAVSASSREGQSVSPDALRRFRVLIPPVELQESFCRVQERPLGRSRNAAVESAVLQELRDALLPRLLEGRWNGTLA